jgi:hypothetical protein
MLQIQILDAKNHVKETSRECGDGVALAYLASYGKGDRIHLQTDKAGLYRIQLDEALGACTVYLGTEAFYEIPMTEEERTCFPPTSFAGDTHLLTLCRAEGEPIRRNLACNPYDNHHTKGIFPHATANVETRNEMVFAARNAIDGIFANHSHGIYPFQSWGINRNPDAELALDFGRKILADTIRITLRGDWPHDSWWTEATIRFDDGSSLVCPLQKSALPQTFPIGKKEISSLTIGSLRKADDESPFPALTQIEVFGTELA